VIAAPHPAPTVTIYDLIYDPLSMIIGRGLERKRSIEKAHGFRILNCFMCYIIPLNHYDWWLVGNTVTLSHPRSQALSLLEGEKDLGWGWSRGSGWRMTLSTDCQKN
jgi:hypothetical protein